MATRQKSIGANIHKSKKGMVISMRMCSIASGSSGNCVYVGTEATHLLVDVGISCKRTVEGLEKLGLTGKDVDGILITHEHADHINGLGVLSRKFEIPIYATAGTIEAIKNTKSLGDINEELFVTEFAKYITNQPSALNSLSSQELEEISYNVHRLLDSILMGANSSNLYENQVYGMSMKELAQRLDSATMNNDFFERLSDAEVHRTLQNFKSELMESGKLKEYC